MKLWLGGSNTMVRIWAEFLSARVINLVRVGNGNILFHPSFSGGASVIAFPHTVLFDTVVGSVDQLGCITRQVALFRHMCYMCCIRPLGHTAKTKIGKLRA